MGAVVIKEVPAKSQKEYGSVREGDTIRQFILNESVSDGLNFKVFRSQFQPGASAHQTPRHHHAFQQVRWAESGSVNYAPGFDIPEGDVCYFPRGAYYGPQLKDQGITVTLQLGFGQEQHGAKSNQVREAATERLMKVGRFENGLYFDTDPETGKERVRDSVHAIYESEAEYSKGEKFEVPPEGYETPILIHTQAFEFFEVAYGVEVKYLGNFYDHSGPNADTALSIIRLSDGGVYTFEADRTQVAWVKNAGLIIDGKTYPELTAFYSPRGETMEISSKDPIEVRVTTMPRLD